MSPVLPDDSVLLTLPFGGAVLQSLGIHQLKVFEIAIIEIIFYCLGVSKPEIDAILEDFRKMYIDDKELDEDSFDFLTSFRRRLPPSMPEPEISNTLDLITNEVSEISNRNVDESSIKLEASADYNRDKMSEVDLSRYSDNLDSTVDFGVKNDLDISIDIDSSFKSVNRGIDSDAKSSIEDNIDSGMNYDIHDSLSSQSTDTDDFER